MIFLSYKYFLNIGLFFYVFYSSLKVLCSLVFLSKHLVTLPAFHLQGLLRSSHVHQLFDEQEL